MLIRKMSVQGNSEEHGARISSTREDMFFLINASYFWLVFTSLIYCSYYGNHCITLSRAHMKLCLLMLAKHLKIRESRACKTIKNTLLSLLFDQSNREICFKNASVH